MALVCFSASAGATNQFDLIVPHPPGGVSDVVGRHVAKVLADANIPTVVQNKAGAQGTIGVKAVTAGTNIQNTLLVLGTGPGLYAPLMMDPAPYNVLEDLEIVATISSDSVVIIVPGTSQVKNAKDLVKSIRTAKQPLRYSTGAVSMQFAGLLFLNKIGAEAIDVPFNGNAPAVLAVASNNVEFGFVTFTDAKEMAKSGRVRIVGMASAQRHPADTTIPTFREQGIDFEQQSWFAIAAHKNMDRATVARLNAVITNSLRNDKTSYVATEMIPMINNIPDSRAFVATQYRIYRPLIEKTMAAKKTK